MLKTLRLRRFFGVIAAILGVAALAFAADPPPPGACLVEDGAWATADGGCKDLVSGLVFSSRATTRENGSGYKWDQAVNACAALAEGGKSDWRLPTVKEIGVEALNGASTHLMTNMWASQSWHTWTSNARGNKAYIGKLDDGTYYLVLKGSGTDTFCVRP